jgi:hypothetical protein
MEPARRRSPMWVRELPRHTLHAMAERFNRDRVSADLSNAQEWLYDALISELEYRRRNASPGWSACSCYLCSDPFDPRISDGADAAG